MNNSIININMYKSRYKVDSPEYSYAQYEQGVAPGSCERLAVGALHMAAARYALARRGLQIDLATYRDRHLIRRDGYDPLSMKPDPENPYHFYAGEAGVLRVDGRPDKGSDGYTSIHFRSAPGYKPQVLLQRADGLVTFLHDDPGFIAYLTYEQALQDDFIRGNQALRKPMPGQQYIAA